ncbi:PhzF family phenazine biosynthesis protein [Sphingomonas sp. HDW15A]|uniref:PhzF family phenazine biosynthesis protein n=1 Tax=Sphingomonas sp. HDW15A TaxID=2714942 RepID=UPI00140C5850|nr:PhzF family phenazine biosynthesis protein [Sphingomonas sp. HDW15A]QIK95276.1 PhzF family phenazine biosynthesis protein [Sphingomonas sp. HDW15A]
MIDLPIFQVDAFASRPFTGNPAAVMPLDQWLPDDIMQMIAAENNLAETAFLVRCEHDDADYDLRWFTPTVEVDLCGHATLASAHVLPFDDRIRFATRSGILTVEKRDGKLWLDLPTGSVEPGTEPGLLEALGLRENTPCFLGRGGNGAAIALLENEAAVRAVDPDFRALKGYDRLVMVTATGDNTDVVSRVFAAYHGIDEDPVTGSAHGSLVPFWANRLGRIRFTAFQASKRGGHLVCELSNDRVILGGTCVTVIDGRFRI